MYSYKVVEGALLDAFEISNERRLAFRGRLRNLQRLGFTPDKPGSGKYTKYTASDILDFGLALSFADIGVDPKKIALQFKRGEAASISNGRCCVFYPGGFIQGGEEFGYVNFESIQRMAAHAPRFAVVSIDIIRFKIGAYLHFVKKDAE